MTLQLQVKVDEDGNAIVPIGKTLNGQTVSIRVEVVSDPVRPAKVSPGDDPLMDAFEQTLRDARANVQRVEPETLTAEQKANRAALVDSLAGSWIGSFPELEDPPSEPEKLF